MIIKNKTFLHSSGRRITFNSDAFGIQVEQYDPVSDLASTAPMNGVEYERVMGIIMNSESWRAI